MKIIKLKISDFKKLKNIDKDINGQNIILLGENGVGKSSIMQFIQLALGNTKHTPELESGEGTVIADKDGKEWTFHVEYKKGKPVITVTSPDGFKDNRKSVLANIVGAIDFDIDEFVQMSESTSGRKKQVEVFKSFLPKETQDFLSDQEYRVERAYKERTEKNQQAKTLEGYIAEHPFKKIIDFPKSKVDVSSLNESIQEATKHNEKVAGAKLRLEQRNKDIMSIIQQIKELEEKKEELLKLNAEAGPWLDKNREIDVSELLNQQSNAHTINAAFEKKEDYDKQFKQLTALKEEAGDLTVFIETSRQAIADAIRDCESPVEGLSFDEDSLIYNGIPVSTSSLSSSEIMHLGYKLKVAENPNLGLLFINRGESLGQARLKEIQDMANKYDLQIFMEQVERGTDELKIEIMKGE